MSPPLTINQHVERWLDVYAILGAVARARAAGCYTPRSVLRALVSIERTRREAMVWAVRGEQVRQ